MLPQTLEELDALRDECKSMVTKRAGLSAGAAIVPIPGVDLGADMTLLMEMIPAINQKFGLNPDQIEGLDPKVKRIILIGATSLGSTLVGKWVTKEMVIQLLKRVGIKVTTKAVAKFVPFIGQAVSASISFGAMKMLGNAHVDDCYKVARKALLGLNADTPRVIEVTPDMVESRNP